MRINDIERYEIIAHAFRRMTGMMAPGKDVADNDYQESMERREEAWRHWNHTHGRVITALLNAMCDIMPDDVEAYQYKSYLETAMKLMQDSGADKREYVVYATLSAGLTEGMQL